ncbi:MULTISPECIES: S8 family serine peptidase [Myxococcaceae]|uniref:S8 family serine peptidase n=1 Tax=Myxococcaceae TaxID=31 RepID=UPI00188E5C1D|nr:MULTISPECIES: S8 family serine peptidase [Myxococcaceae]MBF5045356.1 S8 family serine peptidase [Simulacricoccus sp. 17bor-14]
MQRRVVVGWAALALGLGAGLAAGCGGDAKREPQELDRPTCSASLQDAPEAQLPADAEGRRPWLVRVPGGGGAQAQAAGRVSALAAAQAAVGHVGGRPVRALRGLPVLLARLTDAEAAQLARDPAVAALEPDRPVYALGLPDALARVGARAVLQGASGAFAQAGSAGEHTAGGRQVQAPEVWDADLDGRVDPGAPTGEGIRVCVLDTGLDPRHPELQGPYDPQVAAGHDFVDGDDDPSDYDAATKTWGGGHGTHVAGTIAAQLGSPGGLAPGMDPQGLVGMAPGATLLVGRVLDTTGRGSTATVLEGLTWCQAQGAHIVSLSLGSHTSSPAEESAFEAARQAGLLAIAATGNDSASKSCVVAPVSFPAAYPSVLAVGAVDAAGRIAPFSNQGPATSLVAPGVGVLSTVIRGVDLASDVHVAGAAVPAASIDFAGEGTFRGPLVDCGLAATADSCGALSPALAEKGFVALVQRGQLAFADKVRAVQAQGARAVLIANGDPGAAPGNLTLGGPPPAGAWPPAAVLGKEDAERVRAQAGLSTEVSVHPVDYASFSGTSMAVPHVSGVAALVWSARPGLRADQVRTLLEASARDLGEPGRDPAYGFGLVQARAALERLRSEPPEP